jgi:hypothetical protein
MVTWTIQKADESERKSAEARKRVDTLRTGTGRKDYPCALASPMKGSRACG